MVKEGPNLNNIEESAGFETSTVPCFAQLKEQLDEILWLYFVYDQTS